jgi:transcriptional regulator with XRE-family HTH domain
MTIGERIREARTALGLTQHDLAKWIGVTKQTIFKYETGVITNIPLDKLELMAQYLRIDPVQLAGWAEGENEDNLTSFNDEFLEIKEKLRRNPGMRTLFDAADGGNGGRI